MQESVTFKRLKKRKNNHLKIVIIFFVIAIFSAIIAIGFYLKKKQDSVFFQQSFYFVYASKSKKTSSLEKMQDKLKELGGAGKIYKKDEYYYLIINVYLNEELASQVASDNKAVYESVGVLEIKTKKLNRNSKNAMKNNESALDYVKKFNKSIDEISELQIKYLSSEISENDLCSDILTMKFNFEDLNDSLKIADDSEIKNLVNNYLNLNLMYYSSFFNTFFDSTKKVSVLCEFVVNLTLLKVDLFNNL